MKKRTNEVAHRSPVDSGPRQPGIPTPSGDMNESVDAMKALDDRLR